MNRREFLFATAGTMLASRAPAGLAQGTQFMKSICSVIFPDKMAYADCFAAARNAGFEGIELPLGGKINLSWTPDQAKQLGEAARKAGLSIVSLWVSEPLSSNPLNSPDPMLRARGVETLKKAIDFAALAGCEALLVIPGRLGSGAQFRGGYQDTWDRVSEELKKVIPYAQQSKVCLTPENVWNKFLVSPLEMRAFVDQFQSPWLQTHFDVGNVMQYGYPQDWILTLGSRIRRVHFKDYKLSMRAEQGRFVDLLEGDVDWKAVMSALVKIGYRGFVSPEIDHNPNDPDQLRKVSQALDRILALA
jgi:hexulose-6-phosphate isomerase